MKLFMTALATTALLLTACGKKAEETPTQSEDDFKVVLDANDSAYVAEMVAAYMNFVKDGEYDKAVGMLRFYDQENPDNDPLPIGEKAGERLKAELSQLPVTDWSIREYRFNYPWDNDAVCDVVLKGGLKSKMVLKPIRHFEKWYLSIAERTVN